MLESPNQHKSLSLLKMLYGSTKDDFDESSIEWIFNLVPTT